MLLHTIKTKVKSKSYNLELPNKKSIVLSGSNALQILYTVEALLSGDYLGRYKYFDKKWGFEYQPFTGDSELVFKEGTITGKNGIASFTGRIPKIHCIRTLGKGQFRSFVSSQGVGTSPLSVDMTKYQHTLPEIIWKELISNVNKFLGGEVVTLEKGELKFDWLTSSEYSVEAQKFIYLIFAECYLTPQGYSRVLLMSNIEFLTGRQQVLLIEALDNITGHSCCLSSGNINLSDISSTSIVSILNV